MRGDVCVGGGVVRGCVSEGVVGGMCVLGRSEGGCVCEGGEGVHASDPIHFSHPKLDQIEMTKAQQKQSEMEKLATVLDARGKDLLTDSASFHSPSLPLHLSLSLSLSLLPPPSPVNKVARASGCWVDSPPPSGPPRDSPFLYLVYGVLVRTRPILATSYILSFFLDPASDDMEEHISCQVT